MPSPMELHLERLVKRDRWSYFLAGLGIGVLVALVAVGLTVATWL